MYLDIYRSKKFEMESARWAFDDGTFMYHLSDDTRNLGSRLNELWATYKELNDHQTGLPVYDGFEDWKILSRHEIEDNSDYRIDFSQIVKMSTVPRLADDIYFGLEPSKADTMPQVALKSILSKHVRCILCLSRSEVRRTLRYPNPSVSSVGAPDQGHINNIILSKIGGLLPRMVYKRVI